MLFFNKKDKKQKALEKELSLVIKKESQLKEKAIKAEIAKWQAELKNKVSEKVVQGLELAFNKAFSIVFTKGVGVIEKTYHREEIEKTYSIQNYAFQLRGSRKDLKQLKQNANRSNRTNVALTTIEGVALGTLGIGLPDIIVFVGMLLKGIYQTALNYGFDYDSLDEQNFILCMIEAALTKGPDFIMINEKVDEMIEGLPSIKEEMLKVQLQKTSNTFASDMLIMKFIQGFPIIGVIGGVANPIYYNKIMNYVRLKYQKRYLMMKLKD